MTKPDRHVKACNQSETAAYSVQRLTCRSAFCSCGTVDCRGRCRSQRQGLLRQGLSSAATTAPRPPRHVRAAASSQLQRVLLCHLPQEGQPRPSSRASVCTARTPAQRRAHSRTVQALDVSRFSQARLGSLSAHARQAKRLRTPSWSQGPDATSLPQPPSRALAARTSRNQLCAALQPPHPPASPSAPRTGRATRSPPRPQTPCT
eukprot:5911294-Prymnesium_polylepis.1